MKTLILRTLVTIFMLPSLLFTGLSSVYAAETTCPPPTTVLIDIKPADPLNKINLSAKGLLPVAVLATEDFDASQFAPEMAHLTDGTVAMDCSGAMATRWNYADANNDGLVDLVFFFRIQDLNLTVNSTAATLMAHGTYYATPDFHIMGTDSILVKP